MSITSKARILGALGALALGGCLPGPWDYAPENPPVFRGVNAMAYAIADRPVENVCFERLLELTDGSTDARAWFDSALVRIEGQFSNGGQNLTLARKPGEVTCFVGPAASRFVRGQSYTLTARFVWDSAGTPVVSLLTATARVPLDFSIRDTAYAPRAAHLGVANIDVLDPASKEVLPFVNGDSIYYMSEAEDANFSELSHFFKARRSPDVSGVLITRRFDSLASRPVTSFDSILGIVPTVADFYQAGTSNRLIFWSDFSIGGRSLLDSMGVVNAWYWTGRNRLYFYGAETIYRAYQDALAEAQQNSKIRLPSNVTGGKGFFAGMVADSFDVNIRLDGATQAFPLVQSRNAACKGPGWFRDRACFPHYRPMCRDSLWSRPDCRVDGAYTLLNPVDSASAPVWLPDSVKAWVLADTALAPQARRRYCIDNNYTAGPKAACDAVRAECGNGETRNACKEILWKRCEIAYWDSTTLPACGEGLRSFCAANRSVHKVLCRGVN
jgi:hypothetical protein